MIKKVIVNLFILRSLRAFAVERSFFSDETENLENYFEIEYKSFTDGEVILKNVSYDVNMYSTSTRVRIKLEALKEDGGWNKFNKKTFDKLMIELSSIIKKDRNDVKHPVNIVVKIDKEVGIDELVYNKNF